MNLSTLFNPILDFVSPAIYGPLGRSFESARGTAILSTFNELKRCNRMSQVELKAYRDQKLLQLLQHLTHSSPWYVRRCEGHGASLAEVRSADDLAGLPILTRDDLRQVLSESAVGAKLRRHRSYASASGGTTGDPVQLWVSQQSRNYAGAAMLRYLDWWGRKIGERMGVLWGRVGNLNRPLLSIWASNFKRSLTRRLYLNTFYLNDDILDRHYQSLYEFNPVILRGYANSIYLFACHIRDRRLPIWKSLKFISCTSEKLTGMMREVIGNVLQVPVTNYYGCGEVNSVAFECPHHTLHITEEHTILEVVDEDNRPVEDQPGRILLTDLDNFASPLVRYQSGDMGIITREPCACGRSHLVLKDIIGRVSEALELANGHRIGPGYWSTLLRFRQIQQGCVRVITPSHLQIDLILQDELSERDRQYLIQQVNIAVGEGVKVEWRRVDHIPQVKSGKNPWVRRVEDERPVS